MDVRVLVVKISINKHIIIMIYLVYKTDNWHSYASRDLIGIGSNLANAIKLVKEQVKKENCNLNEDDLYNLEHIKQTQNYENEGEFDIDPCEINILY